MRRLLPLLLFLASATPSLVWAIGPGEKAPAFELKDASGKEHSLASLSSRIVYLDFWASWCVPCASSIPFLARLHQERSKEGLEVVAINVDETSSDGVKLLDQLKSTTLPALYNPSGSVAELYAIATMPTSFLIDRDGTVLKRYEGFKESTEAQVLRDIEEVLKK